MTLSVRFRRTGRKTLADHVTTAATTPWVARCSGPGKSYESPGNRPGPRARSIRTLTVRYVRSRDMYAAHRESHMLFGYTKLLVSVFVRKRCEFCSELRNSGSPNMIWIEPTTYLLTTSAVNMSAASVGPRVTDSSSRFQLMYLHD